MCKHPNMILEGVEPHGPCRASDPRFYRATIWLARNNNVYKLCAAIFLMAAVLANAEPQVVASISSAVFG